MFWYSFLRESSGAVTVDWTVLAAAVVGLGVATVGAVRSGTAAMGSDLQTSLSNASVVTVGELGSSDADSSAEAYAFMWFSQAAFNSRLASYGAWSDATLMLGIQSYHTIFSTAQTTNNFTSGHMVNADEYFIMQTLVNQRGLVWPSTVMTPVQVNQLLTTAGLSPACTSYGCATAP